MTIEIKAGEQKAPPMTELETLREFAERAIQKLQDFVEKSDEIKSTLEVETAPNPWPQRGDEYWVINTEGEVLQFSWAGDRLDAGCLLIGNIFRTEQEAIDERDRRKITAIMREMSDGGPFVFRTPRFNARSITIDNVGWYGLNEPSFSARELAQACLDRVVEMLSENGTRDGMARLLELWVAK